MDSWDPSSSDRSTHLYSIVHGCLHPSRWFLCMCHLAYHSDSSDPQLPSSACRCSPNDIDPSASCLRKLSLHFLPFGTNLRKMGADIYINRREMHDSLFMHKVRVLFGCNAIRWTLQLFQPFLGCPMRNMHGPINRPFWALLICCPHWHAHLLLTCE
jgi:hypothetical protein